MMKLKDCWNQFTKRFLMLLLAAALASQCLSPVFALGDRLPVSTGDTSETIFDSELDTGEWQEEPEEEEREASKEPDSGLPPELIPASALLRPLTVETHDSGVLDFLGTGMPQIVKSMDKNNQPIYFSESEVVSRDGDFVLYFTYTLSESVRIGVPYQMKLPAGLKNLPPSVNVKLGNQIVAVVTIEPDGAGYLLQLTFSDVGSRNGRFWFAGSFDADKLENGGKTKLDFSAGGTIIASSTIDFEIEPIEPGMKLEKTTGDVDLMNKRIPWRVTAEPSIKNAKDEDRRFTTWTITDTLPVKGQNSDLVFNTNQYSVTGPTGGAYTGGTMEFGIDKKSFTYTFPSGIKINEGDRYTIIVYTDFTLEAFKNVTSGKAVFYNKATTAVEAPQYMKDPRTGKSVIDPGQSSTLTSPPQKEAMAEVSGISLSKTGKMSTSRTAQWTVEVTNALNLKTPTLVDTLPEGVTLTGAPMLEGIALKKLTGPPALGWEASSYYDSGNILTFYLPEGKTEKQVLTYDTQLNSGFQGSSIPNHVVFRGDGTPGLSMEKGYTVDIGSGLVSKSGDYNPSDHTIDWTVKLRAEGNGMTNVSVTDKIPDDQVYVESLSGGSAGVTYEYNTNSKTLTIKFNDPGSTGTEQTARFRTRLTDDKNVLWAANLADGVKVKNTITLHASGMASESYSVTGQATVTSTVLEKEPYLHYDPVTKLARWKVTINRNKMEMTAPVLTDTVNEGWTFDENCVESVTRGGVAVSGWKHSLSADGRTMELKLPDTAVNDEPLVVIYHTRLTDLDKLLENKPFRVQNTATLTAKQIPGSVAQTVGQQVGFSLLDKTVDAGKVLSEGYLTWRIDINKDMFPVKADKAGDMVQLVDTLQEGLSLNIDSVKLEKATYDHENGKWRYVELSRDLYGASYDASSREFILDFKVAEITSAYRLAYATDVMAGGSYSNKVKFSGVSDGITAEGDTSTNVNFGGGDATPPALKEKGRIKILKVDEKNNPLDGAVFTLIRNVDGALPITITPTNGEALSELLTPGEYILTEITAPDGYAKALSIPKVIVVKGQMVEVTVKNLPIQGTLTIEKTDGASGKALAGAKITLFQWISSKWVKVADSITDAGGMAIFAGLKVGRYKAEETAAPNGYHNEGPSHFFTIADDGKQPVLAPWTLSNVKIFANLEILKTDGTTGQPLSGVTIRLERADGSSVSSATTGANGIVRFDGLLMGEYHYRETAAPAEYQLDETPHPISVTGAVHGQTLTKTLINTKKTGAIEIKKTDARGTKPLSGAVIELLHADQSSFGRATSDKEGIARFTNVPVGSYQYREIKAPAGYRLDNSLYPIEVLLDGQGAVVPAIATLTNRKISNGGDGGDSDDSNRPVSPDMVSSTPAPSSPSAALPQQSSVATQEVPPVILDKLPDPNAPGSPKRVIIINDYGIPVAIYSKEYDPVTQKFVYIEDTSIPLTSYAGNPGMGTVTLQKDGPSLTSLGSTPPDAYENPLRAALPLLCAGLLAGTAILIPLTLRRRRKKEK